MFGNATAIVLAQVDPFDLKWVLNFFIDTRTGVIAVLAFGIWFVNRLRSEAEAENAKLRTELKAEQDSNKASQKELLERVIKALADATTSVNANVTATGATQNIISAVRDLLLLRFGGTSDDTHRAAKTKVDR